MPRLRKSSTAFALCVTLLCVTCGAEPRNGDRTGKGAGPHGAADRRAEGPAEIPLNPVVYLLRDPAIHAELRLSAAQKNALTELAASANEPMLQLRNASAESGPGSDELRRLTRNVSDRARLILSASQLQRVRQIALQLQGVAALSRADIVSRLVLTAEQQQTMKKLQEDFRAELKELGTQAAAGKDLVELNRRARQRQSEVAEELLNVLNTTQKNRWNSLQGKPFDVSRLSPLSALAPEFREVETWINSEPLTFKALRGRVVVLHFYTFGCINCIHNFPSYKNWQEKFQGKKVTLVGIHTPESPGEKVVESVRMKAKENGFRFPIAVDNGMKNWQAWGNTIWPAVYVVDRRGHIRYWWYGELNWQGAEGEKYITAKIEELLTER